jgi:SAM-dependent methyltransferase
MDRRERIVAPLGALSGVGLEIGALHHPIIERTQATVLYVDHADTATLRVKYADHDDVGEIVDVDVVWGDGALSEALGERGPVDWAIASHVIEHVPDLVAWLDQLAEVMRDGGVLSLAIPDKRYCFDIHRRETDPADVVDAWLTARRRPTLGTVYEFYARIQEVDAGQAWAGAYARPDDNVSQGIEWARRAAATDDYFDVHCWAFTPASFVATLRTLFRLGLTSFRVASFEPTRPGELEFFCVFERLPRGLDEADKTARQLASLDPVERQLVSVEAIEIVGGLAPQGVRVMPLSDKEARLVELKRRGAEAARRAVRPWRNRRTTQ